MYTCVPAVGMMNDSLIAVTHFGNDACLACLCATDVSIEPSSLYTTPVLRKGKGRGFWGFVRTA